jgi:ATP-dependent RNA helicase RhlE
VFLVDKNDKPALLRHVLKDSAIKRVLVFTRTKHGANKVTETLEKAQITAEAIHGNKSQNHRQRALSNFKAGTTRVLVATDIAARGIDVDELTHVINYEVPNEPETYVHRIGRTGRAGAFGTAFTFVEEEERAYLQDIQKLIRKQIDVDKEHPYSTNSVAPVSLMGNERIIRPKGPAGRPPRDGRGSSGGGQSRSGAPRSSGSTSGGRSEHRGGGRPQSGGGGERSGTSGGGGQRSSRPFQAGRSGGGEGGRRSS